MFFSTDGSKQGAGVSELLTRGAVGGLLSLALLACSGKQNEPLPSLADDAGGELDGSKLPLFINGTGRALLGAQPAPSIPEPESQGSAPLDEPAPLAPLTECEPGVPATSQLPRLTHVEYDNTVFDLLNLGGQPSSELAPDSAGSVTMQEWEAYVASASSLATRFVADSTARAAVLPCEEDTDACVQLIVEKLGERAFRRPLTVNEVARFEGYYTRRAELTAGGSFDEALTLIVEVLLQSPTFLMRSETTETPSGDSYQLSDYEVASRLSYMLWQSMPDTELFDAAAAGALSTRERVLAQAQRMLENERAHGMVGNFHRFYSRMNGNSRYRAIQHDPAQFPAYTVAQNPLMLEEMELFFDAISFNQGTFQDLLTSPVGFVNAELAPIYGLDPSLFDTKFKRVTYEPSMRPGVFTRAGFLASYAQPTRSSPILRGAFIQKQVLCLDVGNPPPGAAGEPLPTAPEFTTNRQRVDEQTSAAVCASCHVSFLNPPGFVLEAYDAVGSYQDIEADTGAPIDVAAEVYLSADQAVAVAGPADLMIQIANAPNAQRCYAEKWVEFAYRRRLTPPDHCLAQDLSELVASGGYTILNLVADLTQSEFFQSRSVEVSEGGGNASSSTTAGAQPTGSLDVSSDTSSDELVSDVIEPETSGREPSAESELSQASADGQNQTSADTQGRVDGGTVAQDGGQDGSAEEGDAGGARRASLGRFSGDGCACRVLGVPHEGDAGAPGWWALALAALLRRRHGA